MKTRIKYILMALLVVLGMLATGCQPKEVAAPTTEATEAPQATEAVMEELETNACGC